MLRNYLKIAIRSLLGSKLHSTINVVGLSLGIGCCLLIVLFVRDEFTFDTFNQKANRIYRAYSKEDWGPGQQFFNTVTPLPMGQALKDNFPEVTQFARVLKTGTRVRLNDKLFNETLTIADHTLFDVFDFPFVRGAKDRALADPNSLVISEELAKKYFPQADPIGKSLSVQVGENSYDFTVTAVMRIPINSSIQFQLLIQESNLSKIFSAQTLTSNWFNVNPETYVVLREGADPEVLARKFPSVFRTLLGEQAFKESRYAPGLQPLLSIHLDTAFPVGIATVSNPMYSYIMSAIAVLILVVACINFVTLSVGRSLRRAREVGIRKVIGAVRLQLITQFIGEALIVTIVSVIFGLGLAELCLPLFNEFAGKQLAIGIDPFMLGIIGSLTIIVGIIAGSYPALLLSAFRPVLILKGGSLDGNHKQSLRKTLVGVQLVLSIFLISSTLIMRNQLNYLRSRDLGFDKEQLAVVQLRDPRNGPLPKRVVGGFVVAEQFKVALQGDRGVVAVSAASHEFGNGGWANVGFTDNGGTYHNFNFNTVDAAYIPMLNIRMKSGRNFRDDAPSDHTSAIIVNEAFVKEYGWKDAIGRRIPGKNFSEHEIIGVVRDFNYSSLYTKVTPLVMTMNTTVPLSGSENINVDASPFPKLLIRLRAGTISETVSNVKAVWTRLVGDEEFRLTFVDQTLDAQYRADQNLGRIVEITTILAILIGSLGLYGLVSLTMQNRLKEISIRKVLGADDGSLLVLLSGDYIKLVVISLGVSIPMTIYLMQGWLKTFEFRVEIGWMTFALAGGIAFSIAAVSVGIHLVAAVRSQPVKALKWE